jgi:hypothetical protein
VRLCPLTSTYFALRVRVGAPDDLGRLVRKWLCLPTLKQTAPVLVRSRASQTWAMLIKRVYEIDPLACPECGGVMKWSLLSSCGHQSAAMVG